MFPKQNFSVKITDARLLDSKRGTVKRSSKTRTYSLRKTTNTITVNPAPPYAFNERALSVVEGKIDLLDEHIGEYQLEILVKPSVKILYIICLCFVPFQVYFIVTLFHSLSIIKLMILLLFFPPLVYRYIQIQRGIKAMAKKLKEDRLIFVGE
jgi:hypothetical protein